MRTSLEHFRQSTQEELYILVGLIKDKIKYIDKIILFGSYAKDTYVLWDDKIEFGIHTTFQSDLDILVILSKGDIRIAERSIRNKVADVYHQKLQALRQSSPDEIVRKYAPPTFVVEYSDTLNKALEESQYFFTEIISDGIMLHDNELHELAEPKELSYRDIKRIADKEYKPCFKAAKFFLKMGYSAYEDSEYQLGSFLLHQACEKLYNCIGLVFNNFNEKNHNLKELLSKTKRFVPELVTVFPESTPFEARCYNLIWRAYVEGRYNSEFVVTQEEYKYLLDRLEVLKELVLTNNKARFEVYDTLIAEQDACIAACPDEPIIVHDECVGDCLERDTDPSIN